MGLHPDQLGYKTVATGNQAHGVTNERQRHLAKRWAKAHGYEGALGGWIYDNKGQHVAHGYGQLYLKFAYAIEEWAK